MVVLTFCRAKRRIRYKNRQKKRIRRDSPDFWSLRPNNLKPATMRTQYLGLELDSPVVVGSSPYTAALPAIQRLSLIHI